jgi:hypothetical protein
MSVRYTKSTTGSNITIIAGIGISASLCSIIIGFYIIKLYKRKQKQKKDCESEVTEGSLGHEVILINKF